MLVLLAGPLTKAITLRGIALISSIGFLVLASFFPVASHLKAAHVANTWAPKTLWLFGQVAGELWVP